MPELFADLEFRGLVHQMSDETLTKLLDEDHLVAYVGFDPTSDSLQIGNLLQLCTLRRMQQAGHKPLVLAGGGTGMIGDPGGKDSERPLLDREAIDRNVEGIRPQLEKFLDFEPSAGVARAVLVNNADWLGGFSILDFLRDVGKHFTVNQMVAKDSVKTRFERPDQGISYAEFSYMLLQAADYLHLFDTYGCNLQLGASDQWGNIITGVDLIRKVRHESAYALTSPLVLRADGTKFGKSEAGALYLSAAKTSPWALFQYFVRVEDSVVGTYLRYFTFLSREEIEALDNETATAPQHRAAQRRLAREVVKLVHSEEVADRIDQAAAVLYTEDVTGLDEATFLMALEDVPTSDVARDALVGGQLELVEVAVEAGLFDSRSKARTALEQGGLYVNNGRRDASSSPLGQGDLIYDRYVLLRRGRRDFHLLRCS